eukprot:tig00021623_g23009.t1
MSAPAYPLGAIPRRGSMDSTGFAVPHPGSFGNVGLMPAGFPPQLVAGLGAPELVEIAPRHFLQCIRLPNGLFQPISNYVLQAVPIMGKQQEEEPRVRRPQNSFLLFSNEFRGKLRAANKELTNADVSRMLGEKWKALPEEEKKKYRERAEKIRVDFQAKHPDFSYAAKPKRKDSMPGGLPVGGLPMGLPMLAHPPAMHVAPPPAMHVPPPAMTIAPPPPIPAALPVKRSAEAPAGPPVDVKRARAEPQAPVMPAATLPPAPVLPPAAPPAPASAPAAVQRPRAQSISLAVPNTTSPTASTPEVQLLPYMLGDDDDEDGAEPSFTGEEKPSSKDDFWSFVDTAETPVPPMKSADRRMPSAASFYVPEGAVEVMPEPSTASGAPGKGSKTQPALQLFVNPNKYTGSKAGLPSFLSKFNEPDPLDPLAPLSYDDIAAPFASIGAPLPPLGRR